MFNDYADEDDWYLRRPDLVQAELHSLKISDLANDVGGHDVLFALDTQPLPDEPFDWAGIAEDIVPRVQEVLAHVDRCCDGLLDVEYRTACRRLLARAAVGGPKVFRREGKSDTAAAAIVWIIGTANGIFEGHDRKMLASRVVHFLGVKSSAASRADTFLQAAGFRKRYVGLHLGVNYLVSERRGWIIERRERYRDRGCPTCGKKW